MLPPDETSADHLFEDPKPPSGPGSDPGEETPPSGQGAAFTFTCSRCGKESAATEVVRFCPHCGAPAEAGRGASVSIRALLVDDAAIARKKIGAVLKSLGCAVVEATNGIEALKRIDEAKPNLIVLDVNMPQKNGLEVLEELRERPEYRDTAIVMLTAEADASVVSQALKRKADDYLRKDARVDQLKERLMKQITRIRAAG